MKRGLAWYKREQRAILDAIRAARMTDRQAAIYNIVLDLIYDGGGETPDDPKHVASYLSNVGTSAARTTIDQLVDMGKLTRVGGMLHQKRAENEAKTRQNLSETRAEIGRLGGISSGNSRRKPSENNDISEANASSKTQAEKEREKEEEKIPPYAPPEGGLGVVPSTPSASPRKRRQAPHVTAELKAEFARVWTHYPRKVGCGAAESAWASARSSASFEEITQPLGQFIRAVRGLDPERIPHFSTWLNQRRWLDDQSHARNGPRSSTDDLDRLSTISAADDIARLLPIEPRKAIG